MTTEKHTPAERLAQLELGTNTTVAGDVIYVGDPTTLIADPTADHPEGRRGRLVTVFVETDEALPAPTDSGGNPVDPRTFGELTEQPNRADATATPQSNRHDREV